MSTLSEMGLRHGGRVEVELVFGLTVGVSGKGCTYRQFIEVGPNEKMEVIRSRVPFFHIFSARNYDVVCPTQDNRVFEPNELNQLLFRDSNLKSGDELVLKEPEKKVGVKSAMPRRASGEEELEGEGSHEAPLQEEYVDDEDLNTE